VKKFSNIILLVYCSFCLPFLLFIESDSAKKRFRPVAMDRAFSIYFFMGIFVLPVLIYGLPSVASIKAEILSDRVRRAARRKLQTVSISVALLVMMGLTRYFVPPRDSLSLAINIVVFFAMLCLLIWAHFRTKSD
jgi:hypothetical protein